MDAVSEEIVMKNKIVKFYIPCFFFFLCLFHSSFSSALTLDTSFGKNGLIKTRVGHYVDKAQSVVIQPDGKILVAGSSSNNANLDFALVRYMPDGSLDTSFHLNGQVVTVVGSGDDAALGVALQNDGKIVVCGYTFNGKDQDFALLRYTENGDLDTDFGVNGIVTLPVGSGNDVAAAVAIQSDGTILVAGSVEESGGKLGALVRFLANGSIDYSFGRAGVVLVDVGNNAEIAAMAIQKDQNIVLAGSFEENGQRKVLLVRLLSDGLPDSGFGVDGVAETPEGSRESTGKGLWLQEDGAILVAGSVGPEKKQDIALFQFSKEGRLNRDFGGGTGMLSYDGNGGDDVGYGVFANSTTLFVTGYTTVNGLRDLILLQYPLTQNSQAQLSVVTTGINQFDGVAYALALQDNNKLVSVGFSEESGTSSFVLARYTGAEVAISQAATSTSDALFILTTPATEITRVGCFTGGEISEVAGLTFANRGVAYSVAPYPVLKSTASTTTTTTTTSTTTASTIDVAKEGSTSDGTGFGRYPSILEGLTPGTHYYVRAYGVTSDNIVYYGNQVEFDTKDACFIATAAYGSFLDPHVQILRLFRDRYLLNNEPGRIFVHLYYHYSPQFAEFIADQPVLRWVVRIFLFPFVICSYVAVHGGITGMCLVMLTVLLGTMVIRRNMMHLKK
jgi:uncharacterized delta-60 repeat protein